RANIGLALPSGRFELIKADARDRLAQKSLRLPDLGAVDAHPTDERLLHRILGISHRTEHPIGDADELWTQRIEACRGVLCAELRHQAAAARADFAASGSVRSAHKPKPTASRFHPLMTLIISVSFTCSSSVNCAFRAS